MWRKLARHRAVLELCARLPRLVAGLTRQDIRFECILQVVECCLCCEECGTGRSRSGWLGMTSYHCIAFNQLRPFMKVAVSSDFNLVLDTQRKNDEATYYHEPLKHCHRSRVVPD